MLDPVDAEQIVDGEARPFLQLYDALSPSGKPLTTAHTVLASFGVRKSGEEASWRPVALGTGTKCVGERPALAERGLLLLDSHAEVIARRALLCWIYGQLERARAAAQVLPQALLQRLSPSTIRTIKCVWCAAKGAAAGAAAPDGSLYFKMAADEGTFRKAYDWELCFFVSAPPCGAACLLTAAEEPQGRCAIPAPWPLGIPRTGAKRLRLNGVVPAAADVEPYAEGQDREALRRKPGKGRPTRSMSCSDKLARWALLGVQGALLSTLLAAPLHLDACLVGLPPEQCTAGAEAALRHALSGRVEGLRDCLSPPFRWAPPTLRAVPLDPAALAARGLRCSSARTHPAPVSLNWVAGARPRHDGAQRAGGSEEVTLSALGRRQGVSAARLEAQGVAAASRLSTAALLQAWQRLCTAQMQQQPPPGAPSVPCLERDPCGAGPGPDAPDMQEYGAWKAGTAYGRQWGALLRPPSALELWLRKGPVLDERC